MAAGVGPETVCVEPRTPQATPTGAGPPYDSQEYDRNGCIPGKQFGGSCHGMFALDDAVLTGDGCCYSVCKYPPAPCGRPLSIAGQSRVSPPVRRDDWASVGDGLGVAASIDAGLRAHLRDAWLADAAMEHASIAAFARFALELLAVGAPATFIARAHEAALDEARHAQICYALVRAYGGEPLGPGPLSLAGLSLGESLEALAVATVIEGCVGETIAALLLARQAEGCEDANLRRQIDSIAADEAAHAELAYSVVAWAIAKDGRLAGAVDEAFDRALSQLPVMPPQSFDAATLRARGRLDARTYRETVSSIVRDVIEPARRELCAAAASFAAPAGADADRKRGSSIRSA